MPREIRALLRDALERLERSGVPEPRVEAESLLAELLGVGRPSLFLRRDEALPAESAERFEDWLSRRESREPLQHITGRQEFHGLSFIVDRRALIPRPETEGLIDALLDERLAPGACVADLGTGSGCLAVTLAVRGPDLSLFALDASAEALELARDNARRHGVEARIRFANCDLARPPSDWNGRMQAIVANPPYVPEADWRRLEPEVRDHDPRPALVPGPSGLEAYRALAPVALELLVPGGLLLLELGCGQAEAVAELLAAEGYRVRPVRDDLNGIPRVMLAEAPVRMLSSGGAT